MTNKGDSDSDSDSITNVVEGLLIVDREERSDGCDHLCFGRESLIPPLKAQS